MSMKSLIKKIIGFRRRKEIIAIPQLIEDKNLLQNKVAFISGGSGGIGFAIAKTLLESGSKVIIAGTNKKKMSALISELVENYRVNIKGFILDLTALSNLDQIVTDALTLFGKIDIFISSAGTHTQNVNFWNMTSEEYDRILNLNLKASYFLCQAFGKYMRNNNIKGHILVISSSRGSEPAWSPYGISKWGSDGMVKGLAKIMIPYGIVVNGIAPGPTATDLLGVKEGDSIYTTENVVGRYAKPSEISVYAKLLVCDLGNMVVGEVLHISGGRGCFDIR